jgi:uncharacterized repeat protein (TIGR04002 family)
MKNQKIFRLVLTGLFTALIYVVTAHLPRIPIPATRGYIHIGDAVIYLAASILPFPFSAIAAGMGGLLADALSGYVSWAPYTLVIKACLTVSFVSQNDKMLCGQNIFATLAAFPITIGGYYIAAWIMTGSRIVPLAEVPANAVQAAASMTLYLAFAACMDKSHIRTRFSSALR